MSLQDITGFKPGAAFTALIHAYGNTRIGLDAYGQLVSKNLNDLLNTIDEALEVDINNEQLNGTVIVPLYNDEAETIRVTTISKNDLARCLQNDGPDFDLYVTAVIDTTPTNIRVTSSQIIDCFSRYTDQCAGMKSLISQVVNSDFNLTFSQLYPTTIKGGVEISEWLSNLIENTSGSTNVLKVLSTILSNQVESSEIKSDYIFKEDYTGGNSWIVGFNAIADDVTTFFDSLDFNISKIGDSIKQIGVKIFDALKYLLSNTFVELNQHFILNDKARFETCDVPIIHSTFTARDLVSLFPFQFTAQRYHFNDDSGFVDVVIDTTQTEQQVAEECIIRVLQSIINNGNLIFPIAGNFILLSLPEGYNNNDPISSKVYCGVYPIGIAVPFLNHQYKASIIDNIITPETSGPVYPLMESNSQSNEDVIKFIACSISHDSNVVLPQVPFGSNLETPNMFGSVVGRSINFTVDSTLPDKGADLLLAYSSSFPLTDMNEAAKNFAIYAVIYYLLASDITIVSNAFPGQIKIIGKIFDSANNFIKSIQILNPGFLPYCHTDTFECYVHAQTDTERADEVRDVIKKVLTAAAATAGTTIAFKTKKKLKIRAASKRAYANQLNWDLQNNPNNLTLAEKAVKASKAANKAETLSNILNPVGIAKKMFSSFINTFPNTNQEVRDNQSLTSLNGLRNKYDEDKLAEKLNTVKTLING